MQFVLLWPWLQEKQPCWAVAAGRLDGIWGVDFILKGAYYRKRSFPLSVINLVDSLLQTFVWWKSLLCLTQTLPTSIRDRLISVFLKEGHKGVLFTEIYQGILSFSHKKIFSTSHCIPGFGGHVPLLTQRNQITAIRDLYSLWLCELYGPWALLSTHPEPAGSWVVKCFERVLDFSRLVELI